MVLNMDVRIFLYLLHQAKKKKVFLFIINQLYFFSSQDTKQIKKAKYKLKLIHFNLTYGRCDEQINIAPGTLS